MPQVVKVYSKIRGGKKKGLIKFSCCVNTQGKPTSCQNCFQCKGKTIKGKNCRQHACKDSDFCHIHLKKNFFVVIGISRIPNAGLGLFCWTSKPIVENTFPIFKKGDYIVDYGGHNISREHLNKLYDYRDEHGKKIEPTAPYSVDIGHGRVLDAICKRKAGSYVNDPRDQQKVNSELRNDGKLYATADIFKGDEILVDYGDNYWKHFNEISYDVKNVRAKKKNCNVI